LVLKRGMKEKFIYGRGKGLRRSKVSETIDESSEKFIYGRGKRDEGGFMLIRGYG